MTNKTTRRDLLKPVQLLGLGFAAAVFAGVVTLISMGFFQSRFDGQSQHALVIAAIVAGITFIATMVVIALLMLAIDPADITKQVDRPVLLPKDVPDADTKPVPPRAGTNAPDAPDAPRA